ncbi:hypothetical protein CEUSTIGMA_g9055.t1 [Chlamydomonas eustigma]|uniref:EGF-like domain-containing protein n=1 Tax=Chlamydomonas eustigma TaxID=1157962 RepID=A0A250XEY0_9CHLO|nr:hypothetical protein CEUSTIGMA_g9055.t1 [Chlamydomonas eustigma]|eukprot:GAX81627.1 hypothetical protein CEUSTIGMA_g9055.t1 [Chlamydomonas eustigma]
MLHIFTVNVVCARGYKDISQLELPPAHPWDIQAFLHSIQNHGIHAPRGRNLQGEALKNIIRDHHQLPPPSLLNILKASSRVSENSTVISGRNASLPSSSHATSSAPTHQGVWNRILKPRLCALFKTRSDCLAFYTQHPSPLRPAPRGNNTCPGGCGAGNCHYDLGICMCPAGWKGVKCEEKNLRPCNHRPRGREDPLGNPISHIDPVTKHDLNWTEPGWQASRCAGYCDDTIAACYCGYGSKYAHVPAADAHADWPHGNLLSQLGRPMTLPCHPGTDQRGNPVPLTNAMTTWDTFYGPKGWCNVDEGEQVSMSCPCSSEMTTGIFCHIPQEAYCPRQCSGHGACQSGFCKCHDSWYGTDCSRKVQGLPEEPPSYSPWVLPVVKQKELSLAAISRRMKRRDRVLYSSTNNDPESLLSKQGVPSRKRPYIYVYDVPPQYHSHMLQYKNHASECSWRVFRTTAGQSAGSVRYNASEYTARNTYSIETYLHEAMLNTEHSNFISSSLFPAAFMILIIIRTFDPEEADFFYVPVYITCFIWPVLGYADYPYYYAPVTKPRPMHVTNMVLEIKRWLQKHMPWWDRRGGRDHIWLMPHDEGACYMPTEIYNTSIVLTHWGRLDLDHKSGTGYNPDNYNMPIFWPGYQDTDWRELYKGHACFTPGKDLVIPCFKAPEKFAWSPLLGAAPLERDILLFFRGDVGLSRTPQYSRGIRQEYYILSHERGWRQQYNVYIGITDEYRGDYSQQLARSTFCLVVPGDGYSARYVDAILHGCIPVVVMDNVTEVFETLLDWRQFTVRIKEMHIPLTPQILLSLKPSLVLQMQKRLARVWHRFAWTNSPFHRSTLPEYFKKSAQRNSELFGEKLNSVSQSEHHFSPRKKFPVHEDAFSTVMTWLHGRIKETR